MADKIMEALTRRTDSGRTAIRNVADMFGLADNMSVQTLSIDKLKENKNHPFKLTDDESLDALAKSIKEEGLIQPIIVRTLDSGYYELLAGHRRTLASKKNGSNTIKAFVVDADDETANRIMINTNLQQRTLLPSETAKSYRLRYEDLKKHQTSSEQSLSQDSHISKLMEQEFGASKSKIYMYLRLSYLIDDLLDALDIKKLNIKIAAEISYLEVPVQEIIYELIYKERKYKLDKNKVIQIKKQQLESREDIEELLNSDSSADRRKAFIYDSEISGYIEKFGSEEEMKTAIINFLENC